MIKTIKFGFAFGLGLVGAQAVVAVVDWALTLAYYLYLAPGS